jgi:hypothetical protein
VPRGSRSVSVRERIKRMQQILEDMHQLQLDQAIAGLLNGARYQDPKNLNRYEHKVFSQSGEDGIIAEIFNRIGTTNKVFVECAPGNGLESNTLYLITLGWTGLWIEADPKHLHAIVAGFSKQLKSGILSLQREFVTAENINTLLEKASLPPEFDLLSIDIDRNDYWVWQKIEGYRPRVVVIEYNAIFPPGCHWVVEYAARATWDETSHCGASLTALESLGTEKGYKLVACTLAGTNAFFIREELVADRFQHPFTAENHYQPPRYYLTSRKVGHTRGLP